MAAPTIRGQTAPLAGLTTTSPAGAAVGDLILVFTWERLGAGAGSTLTLHSSMGRELCNFFHNDGSTDGTLGVAAKLVTTAGAQSYQGFTSSVGTETWTGCSVLTGGTFDLNLLNIAVGTAVSDTTSAAPNPPSVTLNAAKDWLVYAVSAWHQSASATNTLTAPTNYTNLIDVVAAATGDLGISSRALTAPASEDPGAYADSITPNGTCSFTFGVSSGSFAPDANAFRFYEDGTESGSVAIVNENTVLVREVIGADSKVHLRVRIQETGGVSGLATDDYQLQYRKNGGAFTNVTAASNDIRVDTASALTDGGATTNRATGITDPVAPAAFVAGVQEEGDGQVANHQLTFGNFTEHVFALLFRVADLKPSDLIEFRITLNGGAPGMTNSAVPTSSIQFVPLYRAGLIANITRQWNRDYSVLSLTGVGLADFPDPPVPKKPDFLSLIYASQPVPPRPVFLRSRVVIEAVPTLGISDVTHVHTAASIVLTQLHILVIQDATHVHTAANLVLTQTHVLVIQDAVHSQVTDNVVLAPFSTGPPKQRFPDLIFRAWRPDYVITTYPAGAGQDFQPDQVIPPRSQLQTVLRAWLPDYSAYYSILFAGDQQAFSFNQLVIADAIHGHTADNLALTQQHVLTIQDAIHAQPTDNVVLGVGQAAPVFSPRSKFSHLFRAWQTSYDIMTQPSGLTADDAPAPPVLSPSESRLQAIYSAWVKPWWPLPPRRLLVPITGVPTLAVSDTLHVQLSDQIQIPGDQPPPRRIDPSFIARFWNPELQVLRVRPKDGQDNPPTPDNPPPTRLIDKTFLQRSWYPAMQIAHMRSKSGASGTSLVISDATHAQPTDALTLGVDTLLSTDARFGPIYSAWQSTSFPAQLRRRLLPQEDAGVPPRRTLLGSILSAWQAAIDSRQKRVFFPPVTGPGTAAGNDAIHSHLADNLTLTQQHQLSIQGATHAQTADNLTLTFGSSLAIQDAQHGQTAGNLALTQQHQLAVQVATHGHTAQTLTIVVQGTSSAFHGHTAQNIVLTQTHVLVVQGAQHAHPVDNCNVTRFPGSRRAHPRRILDSAKKRMLVATTRIRTLLGGGG